MSIRGDLQALADPAYRAFQQGLLPTVPPQRVIGVRVPVLRRYAADLWKTQRPQAEAFLQSLPHASCEEDALHLLLLAKRCKEIDALLSAVDAFLPYVDNWAVCDSFVPPLFRAFPAQTQAAAFRWLQSGRVYTVRFGLVTLLHLLRRGFCEEQLAAAAAAVISGPVREEYYVRMAAAWYFSMALVHQRQAALPWLAENRLPGWVHGKTIQKACESRQFTLQEKQQLRALRRTGS